MINSKLVSYTKISPNKTSPRNHKIDTITIHCVVGQCTLEGLGSVFAPTSRQASSNYGISYDGRIGMYCEEKDRSWCSSNAANDHRAITIEVASDTKHPYAVNDKAYAALIDLCVDICKRNGIKKLVWSTSKNNRIKHLNGCNMTVHRDFANKACPGDYLYSRHGKIADEVNKKLLGKPTSSSSDTIYRVQIGAFSSKANAEKQLKLARDKGFKDAVIVESGSSKPTSKPTLKSIDVIAKEVLAGLWGNGSDRKNWLIEAGYDYNAVQAKVNEIL